MDTGGGPRLGASGEEAARRLLFQKHHPRGTYLDRRDASAIEAYLRRIPGPAGLAGDEKLVSVSSPGEGNMNLVLRVWSSGPRGKRSRILKQARPWCERFPEIAAPPRRLVAEAAFLKRALGIPALRGRFARPLAWDPRSQVLVLEDLGGALGQPNDFGGIYGGAHAPRQGSAGRGLARGEIAELVFLLAHLHSAVVPVRRAPGAVNFAMRRLNWEYIFRRPLAGLDGPTLERRLPGLSSLLAEWVLSAASGPVAARVRKLGAIYLGRLPGVTRAVPLHGDFHPGSWLRGPRGIALIDGEFSFVGPAEWDVGVFLAHLALAGHSPADCEWALESYRKERLAAGEPESPETRKVRLMGGPVDSGLVFGFAGVEIARRVVGVSQLALPGRLDFRRKMLRRAEDWILLAEGNGGRRRGQTRADPGPWRRFYAF
jgi:5-methylthioribose kinase